MNSLLDMAGFVIQCIFHSLISLLSSMVAVSRSELQSFLTARGGRDLWKYFGVSIFGVGEEKLAVLKDFDHV